MKPHPRHGLFAAAILALSVASAPARADDAPDPTAPDRLRAAHAASHDPAILLDLAASLRRLGRNAEAAAAYDEWRRDPRADPARVPDVERELAAIDALVARLTLQFDDPSARLSLDGRDLPGFPNGGMIRVDPGDHTVTASHAGQPPAVARIRVAAGETRVVPFRLGVYSPLPPQPVYAPPVPVPPPAYYAPTPVYVQPVVVVPPPSRPPLAMDGPRLAATLLFVTGGLAVGGGIGAGSAAIVMDVDSRNHCLGGGRACEPRGVELQHQSRVAASASTACFVGGGAMLIAGGIVRAVSRSSSNSSGALLRPYVGASGVGGTW